MAAQSVSVKLASSVTNFHGRQQASRCPHSHVSLYQTEHTPRGDVSLSCFLTSYTSDNGAQRVSSLASPAYTDDICVRAWIITMRVSWILVLSALFAFVLPFLVIYLPYALFSMYMQGLRTASSSIHIQASMDSVFESATAMSCLVLPVSAFAFVCPSIPESYRDSALMLQQVSGAQQTFLDQLTRYAPTPEMFAIVSSIQRAARFAFVFDGAIALQSGHPQGPKGDGAGGVLSDIHHLCRELLVSLREVGLHVEVAVAR